MVQLWLPHIDLQQHGSSNADQTDLALCKNGASADYRSETALRGRIPVMSKQ